MPRRLGELEDAVMTRIWEWNRPVTVREVLEDLQKERTIAYTTVMTVLDNLHQKGWVRREAEGRAYRYEAVSTRAAYAAALMNESWSASDNPAAALVAFFGMMSPEQRAALRDAVHMVGIEQTRSAASDEGPGTPAASPSSSSPATAGAPPSPASPAPEEPKSPNGGPAPGKEADARPDGRVPETGSAPAEESARRPDEPEDDRPEERGPDADRPEEDAVGHGPASREARAEPGPSGPDAER